MNRYKLLFCFVFLISIWQTGSSQDTTRIFFIGNSFTAANAMPQMVFGLANAANIQVHIEEHSPGGATVYYNHIYDPYVMTKLKTEHWDYIVVQDNQGAYCDYYGLIQPYVIAASVQLTDSVKVGNPCGRVVWFAGWAFQGGLPSLWPGDNSVNMISRILANYTYLNDSVNEIVAPIGEAWISTINQQPGWNLWDLDSVHPSLSGSYLTACVFFSAIFKTDPSGLNYNAGLNANKAAWLRNIAYNEVVDSANMVTYNLDMFTPDIHVSSDTISVDALFASYQWYFNGVAVNGAVNPYHKMVSSGNYHVVVSDSSCEYKSLSYYFSITFTEDYDNPEIIQVYPNPARGVVKIEYNSGLIRPNKIVISDILGSPVYEKQISQVANKNLYSIDLSEFAKGLYIISVVDNNNIYTRKVSIY